MTLREAQKELADLIAQMSVLSEVSAMNYDPSGSPKNDGSENSKGGRRPPGGEDRKADREPEFLLKSHSHYVKRARACRSLSDYLAVIADVQKTLKAWKRPPHPLVEGRDPLPGEPFFRRHLERIVQQEMEKPEAQRRSDQKIAWDLGIDRSYVGKVRRDLAA